MTIPTEARPRPDGVTLTAVWFIVSAILPVLGAAAVAIFALPAVIRDTEGADQYFAVAGVSFGLAVLLLMAAVNIAAAVGLLRLRPWSRMLAIVLAALGVFWFPIGTVAGALIIWYLLSDEAREAFGAGPPPTERALPSEKVKAA